MKKMSRILCTLLLCGAVTFEAAAATLQDQGNSPQMSGSTAGRDVDANVRSADGRESARKGAQKGSGTTRRNAGTAVSFRSEPATRPHTVSPLERSNAERLHSLLSAQARGRVARQPARRPVGSAPVSTGGGAGQERLGVMASQQRLGAGPTRFGTSPARLSVNPAPISASPVRQTTQGVASLALTTSPAAARPAPTLTALAIHSTSGLPRAAGPAVVGGPVVGRGVHNSTIDGTGPHHKF
jgi:hypothetical protein